jgi:hypothetical protein
VLEVLDEVYRCPGVDIVPILRSSPTSRAPSPIVVPKKDADTQVGTNDVNPVTDDDTSEPRLGTLIKTFQGMQHMLQTLTKGFKEMIRNKKWAQKAHARRERRRAARQKEVENQPQIPVDCPQTQPVVGEDGIKAEGGPSPRLNTGHHRQS